MAVEGVLEFVRPIFGWLWGEMTVVVDVNDAVDADRRVLESDHPRFE